MRTFSIIGLPLAMILNFSEWQAVCCIVFLPYRISGITLIGNDIAYGSWGPCSFSCFTSNLIPAEFFRNFFWVGTAKIFLEYSFYDDGLFRMNLYFAVPKFIAEWHTGGDIRSAEHSFPIAPAHIAGDGFAFRLCH